MNGLTVNVEYGSLPHTIEYSNLPLRTFLEVNRFFVIKSIFPIYSRRPLCKIWLVGFRLRREQNGESDLSEGKEWGQRVEEQLAKEIDEKILEEYREKVLKGWYQQIKLETKSVGKAELIRDWWEKMIEKNRKLHI